MKNRFKTGFVMLIILCAAVLLMATAAYAQAAAALPPCLNGVQDGNETGVDCGGSCALTVGCVGNCTSAFIVDYCDGKDNDKDCVVDEDCKPSKQVVRAPQQPIVPIKDTPSASPEAKPSCSDSIQNQDELAVDCAGVCTVSAKEVCDGIDNDRDCYVDEGGVCEVQTAQSSSSNLCAFPNRQIGYESNPDYFAVMSPSCIIEDDVGSLDYMSTLNLTKSLNAARVKKETLQSTVALYYQRGKEGRCLAIFTAYPDAASAKNAAASTANSFMPMKNLGSNYAYINDTEGVGYWVKKNYVVIVTNFDYLNNHKWEDNCGELLSAYLAKIGSDLNPDSQTAADEQASTIGQTGSPLAVCANAGSDNTEAECKEVSTPIGAWQVPDENGMVMSCDVNETGVVVCKKVKASELPPVAPDVESTPGVEVVEGTPVSGEASASTPAAETEESQVAEVRRIAKEHNIYLSNYNDKQLLAALQKFSSKHKKELEEKYGNQKPSEGKLAEILKQFSQEEFGNELNTRQQASQQPQKQSFFTKLKSFLKRLL